MDDREKRKSQKIKIKVKNILSWPNALCVNERLAENILFHKQIQEEQRAIDKLLLLFAHVRQFDFFDLRSCVTILANLVRDSDQAQT